MDKGRLLEGTINNESDLLMLLDKLLRAMGNDIAHHLLKILLLNLISSDVNDIPLPEDRYKKGEKLLRRFNEDVLKAYIDGKENVDEIVAIMEAETSTKN